MLLKYVITMNEAMINNNPQENFIRVGVYTI